MIEGCVAGISGSRRRLASNSPMWCATHVCKCG